MLRCQIFGIQFLLVVCALLLLVATSQAQEVRRFQKIRTPGGSAGAAAFQRVEKAVPRGEINGAVQEFAKNWSNRELQGQLAESFQQKQRLLESSELRVPRDAIMQVESTRNIFTLSQEERLGASGRRERVSVVSATVSTRLLVNDPGSGFVSVPGENEILFEVIEELE
jgi:hypothetical protein